MRAGMVLLVLVQFSIVVLDRAFVLCLSDLGHVEIEIAFSGCCAGDLDPESGGPESAAVSFVGPEDPHRDCGSCTDLRVSFSGDRTKPSSRDGDGRLRDGLAFVTSMACPDQSDPRAAQTPTR